MRQQHAIATKICLALLVTALSLTEAMARNRYSQVIRNRMMYRTIPSGELQGLHHWGEGFFQEWNHSIVTKEFIGTVASAGGEWPEGVDIIVEVKGTGENGLVRGQTADSKGRFRFRRLPAGSYTFKITCCGWDSIVGKLEIRRNAGGCNGCTFVMALD